MLLLLLPPPLKWGPSSVILLLLLMTRLCRRINHGQSCTWPWAVAQPEEKLLRMTHCVLEPWPDLIDPMIEVTSAGLPQRVIASSFSDHNYETAFKRLPGSVHSVRLGARRVQALNPKTLPQRPKECYDIIGERTCFQTSKWDDKICFFGIHKSVCHITSYHPIIWQTFSC